MDVYGRRIAGHHRRVWASTSMTSRWMRALAAACGERQALTAAIAQEDVPQDQGTQASS
jgi:hypothetical protein